MLVMEYANNGTLSQYLSKNFNKMNWDLKLKFAKQISSAVFYLHENNIIHKNLVNLLLLSFTFLSKIIIIIYFIYKMMIKKSIQKIFSFIQTILKLEILDYQNRLLMLQCHLQKHLAQ